MLRGWKNGQHPPGSLHRETVDIVYGQTNFGTVGSGEIRWARANTADQKPMVLLQKADTDNNMLS
jgi:hypothetical protein